MSEAVSYTHLKAMKDDFISVEHLFLGLLDEQDQTTSELFRAFNLKKDAFLQQDVYKRQPLE